MDARRCKLLAVIMIRQMTALLHIFTDQHHVRVLQDWLACAWSKAVCCQYILSAEKKPVDKRICPPLRLRLLIILGKCIQPEGYLPKAQSGLYNCHFSSSMIFPPLGNV